MTLKCHLKTSKFQITSIFLTLFVNTYRAIFVIFAWQFWICYQFSLKNLILLLGLWIIWFSSPFASTEYHGDLASLLLSSIGKPRSKTASSISFKLSSVFCIHVISARFSFCLLHASANHLSYFSSFAAAFNFIAFFSISWSCRYHCRCGIVWNANAWRLSNSYRLIRKRPPQATCSHHEKPGRLQSWKR